MSKFDRQLRGAVGEIDKAIEKTIRAAALELFSEIVRRTPVGEPSLWKNPPPEGYVGGRLRGNWQARLRSPGTKELTHKDRTGKLAIQTAKTQIDQFKLKDKSIWLSNNLPYADRVEKGWSSQRPQGMVRSTVKQFKSILEKIARIKKV